MKKIDVSSPLALSKIIASEGLTNQIPADASSIAEQYNASQDVGFPEVTMKPVQVGGEAPDGRDFNGFLQLLSSHLFASQNGGIYTFNADVSSAIGGYPQGAILGYIDTNGDYNFVKSLIDDNTYNFVNNPAYIDNIHWEKIVYPGAANTDLSNLTSQGKNIANWSSNVSNCITEIPQDIKLELNAGTLTLKAGSKVYIPNGVGTFTEQTISSDKVCATSTSVGTRLIFITDSGSFFSILTQYAYSGNTSTMNNTTAYIYARFYNTETNKMYVGDSNGGNWVETSLSLPLAVVTNDSSGNFTAIEQTFNGFGYIGSTIFALPGVVGLASNGFNNVDGTLNNNIKSVSNVLIYTLSGTYNFTLACTGSALGAYYYSYDARTNQVIRTDTGASYNGDRFIYGNVSVENGKITSFNTKTVFHSVDYSDFKTLSESVPNLQQVNVLPVSPDANTWYAIPE